MCFLFVLEIYGNAPLEKSKRQKAQESTLAWSAEGKPCQSTTKHLIFQHRCAASSHAQPANPQVGEITHALPTTHPLPRGMQRRPQGAQSDPCSPGASPQLSTPATLFPSWVQTRGFIHSLLREYLANPRVEFL